MRPHRRLFAVILMTIYLTITLSPLASLAMHSKVVAHVVTGECSGDCDICGCSQESRANHTCCCAKKKQMQVNSAKFSGEECCLAKASTAHASEKDNGCASSQQVEPVDKQHDCCSKNKQHQYDENAQKSQNKEKRSKNETVYKCGCPCGKGQLQALTGFGSNELLPIDLIEMIELPHVATLYADFTHCLESRHGEPPDPRPRLFQLS